MDDLQLQANSELPQDNPPHGRIKPPAIHIIRSISAEIMATIGSLRADLEDKGVAPELFAERLNLLEALLLEQDAILITVLPADRPAPSGESYGNS